MHRTIST
ncbi:hypothetical protein ZEAMMB73_Zm00001d040707 [Zea mays]|nr:hypothetical protein ZEAMMB73_Zm00001d040707 [Zea mays]